MKETPESIHVKKPTYKNTSMDYLNEDKRLKKLDEEKPVIKKIFKYLKNKVKLNPDNKKKESEKILKIIEKDKNLSYEEVVRRINEAYENNNSKPPQE